MCQRFLDFLLWIESWSIYLHLPPNCWQYSHFQNSYTEDLTPNGMAFESGDFGRWLDLEEAMGGLIMGAEDEMVGWYHRLNGHECEKTLWDTGGQGGLVCCSSWGRKWLGMTEHVNNKDIKRGRDRISHLLPLCVYMHAPQRWCEDLTKRCPLKIRKDS